MKDDGGPAFPFVPKWDRNYVRGDSGMSLRAWFAGLAMQGIINRGNLEFKAAERIAAYAVLQADALIAELKK